MKPNKPTPLHDAACLLTVKETAEHLHLSTKTIRRKIKAGELIAHRIGNRLRIAEDDLRMFNFSTGPWASEARYVPVFPHIFGSPCLNRLGNQKRYARFRSTIVHPSTHLTTGD